MHRRDHQGLQGTTVEQVMYRLNLEVEFASFVCGICRVLPLFNMRNTTLLAAGVLYWVVSSLVCFWYLRKEITGRLKYIFKRNPSISEAYLPFERTDFQEWDLTRIYLSCFLIFPFKFALILHYSVTAMSLMVVIAYIEKILQRDYIPFLRAILKFYMNVYAGKTLWLLCPVDEKTEKTTDDSRGPIIICNHQSWWETFYLVATRWPVSFLAKDSVRDMPLVGTVATFAGSIFIERENSKARSDTLDLIKERCDLIKKEGSERHARLIIFPEGTTTNGSSILKFKKGAFECLEPVQISCLNYDCPGWNVSLDQMGELTNILLFLIHSPRLSIHNTPHVLPKSPSVDNFMQDCQRIMANSGASRRVSSSGFRDKKQYERAIIEDYRIHKRD